MFNRQSIIFLVLLLMFSVLEDVSATQISRHTTDQGEVIGDLVYSDTLMTNGGTLAVNKNLAFDSQNQDQGGNNIQSEKVLTYSSREGAHLLGEEVYNIDTAGSYKPDTEGYIHCIFSDGGGSWLPAFCNTVQTKVSFSNSNSVQISGKANARMAGYGQNPAELNFQLAVTPDPGNGLSPAEGMFRTEFTGSVMEGREKNTNASATNQWKDSAEVSGGVTSFRKNYDYQSGFRL